MDTDWDKKVCMESWSKPTILEEEQEAYEEVGVSMENGGLKRRAEESGRGRAGKRSKLEDVQGVVWGEELAMHDTAREDFLRGESGGLRVRKMKQSKLVPLPIMELGIKRLVLSLVCESVEVGEEKPKSWS